MKQNNSDRKKRRKWDVVDLEALKKHAMNASEKAQHLSSIFAAKSPFAPESFSVEIDINNCPAATRYYLTKGSTHDQIQKETGVVVITRGQYISPEERNTSLEKPLHLHVTAKTKDSISKAELKIREIINSNMECSTIPNRLNVFVTQVYVGIDINIDPEFGLISKITGNQNQYLQHISNDSGASVILRGKDSPYSIDPEPLHIYISAINQTSLDIAKKLAQDLIDTVHKQYEDYMLMKRDGYQPYASLVGPGGYPYAASTAVYDYTYGQYGGYTPTTSGIYYTQPPMRINNNGNQISSSMSPTYMITNGYSNGDRTTLVSRGYTSDMSGRVTSTSKLFDDSRPLQGPALPLTDVDPYPSPISYKIEQQQPLSKTTRKRRFQEVVDSSDQFQLGRTNQVILGDQNTQKTTLTNNNNLLNDQNATTNNNISRPLSPKSRQKRDRELMPPPPPGFKNKKRQQKKKNVIETGGFKLVDYDDDPETDPKTPPPTVVGNQSNATTTKSETGNMPFWAAPKRNDTPKPKIKGVVKYDNNNRYESRLKQEIHTGLGISKYL